MKNSMSTASSFQAWVMPVTDSTELSDNVTQLDAPPSMAR
jgi:hypothetical protein